jgi:regulatory protein
MDLLARREHSSQEILTKLQRRFRTAVVTEDMFHDVIGTLTSEGLLSNERYAQSMARQLIGRGSGPKKLTYELKQKGCDPQSALDSAFPDGVDWFALAEELYDRKFGHKTLPAEWQEKQKERAKRGRFMASRGFSPNHFIHLLDTGSD